MAMEIAPADAVNQRQTELIVRQNNYSRIASDYDAAMRDAFRAKLVKPADVPDKAPTLDEMRSQVAMCTE